MKLMNRTQKEILALLQTNNSISVQCIHQLTGYKPSTITSRVAELRKLGYDIDTVEKLKSYYVLKKQSPIAEKILATINEKNLWSKTIHIDAFAKNLNITRQSLIDGLISISKKHKLIQLSNNEVVVKNL